MSPSPSAKSNQPTLSQRLQDTIIEKVNGSRVTIVVGPTGSGKVSEEIRRQMCEDGDVTKSGVLTL